MVNNVNVDTDIPKLFEMATEKKTDKKLPRRTKLKYSLDTEVTERIWEYYVSTFWNGKGIRPRLSPERVDIIARAVNWYDEDTVMKAIRGCSLSDWHMGRNPSGKKYTSIELILRDSPHIERFYEMTVAEDSKGGFLD